MFIVHGHDGVLIYLLAESLENKTPLWVIEHLTAEKAQANVVQRYNKFQANPDLEKSKRAELSDYKNSGYDRGHMAPSADMKWDKDPLGPNALRDKVSCPELYKRHGIHFIQDDCGFYIAVPKKTLVRVNSYRRYRDY